MNYIVTMVTTIQVSKELLSKLKSMKMHNGESYEDIIWDLVEDRMELSKETKRDIEKARKDFANGKYFTFEEIKEKMRNVRS